MRSKSLIAMGFILLLGFLILSLSGVAYSDDGVSRSILKTGSLLAAIFTIIGIALAGYFAGKSYDSHTGWERYNHGAGQFYNRKPFRKDRPTYGVTEEPTRLNWEESLFNRLSTLKSLVHPPEGGEPKWVPPMGVDALPDPIRGFFKENEERYKNTLKTLQLMDQQVANWENFEVQFAIADAWSNAHDFLPSRRGRPRSGIIEGFEERRPSPLKASDTLPN